MRLLLVEDDAILGDGIRAGLRLEGYTVDWVRDGVQAGLALETESFSAVVLDLGLPRRDGLEVLGELRRRSNDVPVLVLTARDTTADRVRGLDTGADDYLVKPFDLDELAARLRALRRRSKGRSNPVIEVGLLRLDPAAHTAHYDGNEIGLSPREFTALQILAESAGRVVAKPRLQEGLYGWDRDVESNAVEVHIHHLRRKLGANLIRTVRGVGYLLSDTEA